MKFSNWINHFAPAAGPPPARLHTFFQWALKGSFPVLTISGILSISAGIIDVSAALLLGLIIDSVLISSEKSFTESNFWLFLAGIVFFLILRPIVFGFWSYMQSVVITPNIFNLILSRLHRWILGQSIDFFENDFAGRISQKEMQTARAVTDIVVDMIHTVLFALASVLGAILMMSSVNLLMASGLIVWLIAYLLLIRYFMPLIQKQSGIRAGSRAMITGQIVDTVTNIKTVKLFAHDLHEDQAALKAMDNFRKTSLKYGFLSASFRFYLNTLAGILPIILVGGSIWFFISGTASAGDMAAAGAISLRLAQMTGWVSFTLMTLYTNLGEVEDGIKTLSSKHTLTDSADAKELNVTSGEIIFENVNFAYGQGIAGVDKILIKIRPGEKVGIVGASGAGKSTLVSLLLRLYDPKNGSVRIDGQDIKSVSQESLRRQIGMVTQETALFNRSARDNILYGRNNADEASLINAAKQAEAHDFILQLRDHRGREGYDAHLGEQGVKLSGGQRQRIALARAILKDAPILVLDEATSALDSEVEAIIQVALERVMTGKTVLAIAHRLSTLNKMDRIIVMDNGHIVETGSHEELLRLGGLYYKYSIRQSGGFIDTNLAAE